MLHDKVFGLLGMTLSIIRPNYSMTLMDLYLYTLIEALVDIWQAANMSMSRTARSKQMANLHDSLCIALEMYEYRLAIVLMSDVVFSLFGRRCDAAFYDWPQSAVARQCSLASSCHTASVIGWTRETVLKHLGTATAQPYRLALKYIKTQNGHLQVPDAYANPMQIRYSKVVQRIEAIYQDVLELKFGGRTLYSTLSAKIPDLPSADMSQTIDQIIAFPTPREAISLLSQGEEVLDRNLHNEALDRTTDGMAQGASRRQALHEALRSLSAESKNRLAQFTAPESGYFRESLIDRHSIVRMSKMFLDSY